MRRLRPDKNFSITILLGFNVLIWAILIFHLGQLQIGQAAYFQNKAGLLNDFTEIRPVRGNIYVQDKDGHRYLVATTINAYDVYFNPLMVKNFNQEANTIALDLNIDPKILKTATHSIMIAKDIPSQVENRLISLRYDSLFFNQKYLRYYPEGNFLSRIIGFTSFDQNNNLVGRYGLESYYNDLLAGQPGYRDSFGQIQPAVAGSDLVLNIDYFVQKEAEKVLVDGIKKYRAQGGSASGGLIAVVRPNGQVVAAAEFPNYNLNDFQNVPPSDYGVFLSRLVENYEPGSVFKAITYSAALQEGLISEKTKYFDHGYINVDGWKIWNFDYQGRGEVSLLRAFEESLNTGAAYVESLLGNPTFLSYVKKYRVDRRPEIDLPYLTKGDISTLYPPYGRNVNYVTASFGQGVSLSPAALLMVYNVFANNGMMYNLSLVNKIVYPNGQIVDENPIKIGQIISLQTNDKFKRFLAQVVIAGSGQFAKVQGYTMGGKTGSAYIPNKNKTGYSHELINTFIDILPLNQPQFIVFVQIDNPGALSELTAVPLAKKINEFLVNYYNIPPDNLAELRPASN
ncbi:MAG: penicillin-binding protein 2 [Patescibacteria group bacterium]|nr:penicillin-binding protein 2 [Patescibacteria group bacterium]